MMPFALLLLAASHEALVIPLALLTVFASAKLLADLFERIGQPGIIGEILAGVLIGPSVLNWVTRDGFLAALGDLGVMFLLFRVGLEVKPDELLKLGGTAAFVAACGVVVPFIMGWNILAAWGAPPVEAIFVGAAMVATSVGITAQVLAANGLLHEKSSQIILAAVSGMAKGKVDLVEIGLTCLFAVAFVVVIAVWGNRAMGRVVPRLQQSLRVAEAKFSMAMVLLFALSVLAVYVGVAAIVGAFFAGMALAGRVGPRVHDLASGASELLVPFFLAGIGLNVSLAAFQRPSLVILTVVIIVAAVVSKMIGCGLSALPLGRLEAWRIGVGMIPRGEVGMVVAQIGLSLGAVSRDIYGVVVLMAVATTIVAPPLIAIAYKEAVPLLDTEVARVG